MLNETFSVIFKHPEVFKIGWKMFHQGLELSWSAGTTPTLRSPPTPTCLTT